MKRTVFVSRLYLCGPERVLVRSQTQGRGKQWTHTHPPLLTPGMVVFCHSNLKWIILHGFDICLSASLLQYKMYVS